MRSGHRLFLPILALALALPLSAKDLRITIPKRSHLTPVQKLNRDGVKQIEKHDYDRAKKLFYQAYLLDPNDPFTLNNLGYMAELEGNAERAARYYELAREQQSEALVDISNTADAKGKTVLQVAGHANPAHMQVNSLNIGALEFLMKDRAPEADILLTRSLALDPNNAFTLNNLGYAKEKEGEYTQAQQYYEKAAALHSDAPVIVTEIRSWRGRPISEVAAESARNVQRLARREQRDSTFRVASLNLRGVSAINRNEAAKAAQYFEQAYKLAPHDAFTLNNMGYLAEMQGDRETAQLFYDRAQQARRAGETVEVASRADAEGHELAHVAEGSESQVEKQIATESAQRRRNQGPPVLKHRTPAQQQPGETPAPPSPPQ